MGQTGQRSSHQASKKVYVGNLSKFLKFVGLLRNIFRFHNCTRNRSYTAGRSEGRQYQHHPSNFKIQVLFKFFTINLNLSFSRAIFNILK